MRSITSKDYLSLRLPDRRAVDMWVQSFGVVPAVVFLIAEETDGRIHIHFHQRYADGSFRIGYEGEEGPKGELILPPDVRWPLG